MGSAAISHFAQLADGLLLPSVPRCNPDLHLGETKLGNQHIGTVRFRILVGEPSRRDCGARIVFKRIHFGAFSTSRFALLHSAQIAYFAFYFYFLSKCSFFLSNGGLTWPAWGSDNFFHSRRPPTEHLSNLTLTQSEKVIIFCDKQTDRHFSKNVTDTFLRFTRGGGRGVNKQKRRSLLGVPTDILDV